MIVPISREVKQSQIAPCAVCTLGNWLITNVPPLGLLLGFKEPSDKRHSEQATRYVVLRNTERDRTTCLALLFDARLAYHLKGSLGGGGGCSIHALGTSTLSGVNGQG